MPDTHHPSSQPSPPRPRPRQRAFADQAPRLSGGALPRAAGGHVDVLIADDDPTALACVRETLTDAGLSVATASSGGEAIRTAGILCPRLLILDVGMPDLDGYHVCRRLRSDASTGDLPILFLSASSAVTSRLAGFHAGAVDFLAKPFEPAELLARVDAQLELVTLREKLAQHNSELARANKDLRAGITAASRVQKAMLPQVEVSDRRVGFAWRCIQCDQLGGDAVNILRLSRDVYAFYVLDASGHGVPASLLAVATGYFVTALYGSHAQNTSKSETASPAAVIGSVNRLLGQVAPAGAFVTIICGLMNAADGSLTFAAAGHPGPLLLRLGRPPVFLDRPAPPAGICDWTFEDQRIELAAGDRILLYSDGLYEQRNAAGDRPDRSEFMNWSAGCLPCSAQEAATQVMQAFDRWRGSCAIDDDLLLLAIDYSGGRP